MEPIKGGKLNNPENGRKGI